MIARDVYFETTNRQQKKSMDLMDGKNGRSPCAIPKDKIDGATLTRGGASGGTEAFNNG
jgi:hypothetical protein